MGAVLGFTFAAGALLVLSGSSGAARLTPAKGARRRIRPPGWWFRQIAAALAAALVAILVTGVPAVALVAMAAGAAAPAMWARRAAAQRRRQQEHSWPDAVDMVIGGLRAGVPLAQCLVDLRDHGPEPLRPYFAAFADCYEDGVGVRESLSALQSTAAHPAADRLCLTLRLAHEGGGAQTASMLATLAEFLRTDLRLRAEIEARQSWTLSAARLAVAAPWIALLLLSTRGSAASAYASGAGTAMIAATAGISVLAYLAMRRLARIPATGRLVGEPV